MRRGARQARGTAPITLPPALLPPTPPTRPPLPRGGNAARLPGRPNARVARLALVPSIRDVAAVASLDRVRLVAGRVREVLRPVVEQQLVGVSVREGESVATAGSVLRRVGRGERGGERTKGEGTGSAEAAGSGAPGGRRSARPSPRGTSQHAAQRRSGAHDSASAHLPKGTRRVRIVVRDAADLVRLACGAVEGGGGGAGQARATACAPVAKRGWEEIRRGRVRLARRKR